MLFFNWAGLWEVGAADGWAGQISIPVLDAYIAGKNVAGFTFGKLSAFCVFPNDYDLTCMAPPNRIAGIVCGTGYSVHIVQTPRQCLSTGCCFCHASGHTVCFATLPYADCTEVQFPPWRDCARSRPASTRLRLGTLSFALRVLVWTMVTSHTPTVVYRNLFFIPACGR